MLNSQTTDRLEFGQGGESFLIDRSRHLNMLMVMEQPEEPLVWKPQWSSLNQKTIESSARIQELARSLKIDDYAGVKHQVEDDGRWCQIKRVYGSRYLVEMHPDTHGDGCTCVGGMNFFEINLATPDIAASAIWAWMHGRDIPRDYHAVPRVAK